MKKKGPAIPSLRASHSVKTFKSTERVSSSETVIGSAIPRSSMESMPSPSASRAGSDNSDRDKPEVETAFIAPASAQNATSKVKTLLRSIQGPAVATSVAQAVPRTSGAPRMSAKGPSAPSSQDPPTSTRTLRSAASRASLSLTSAPLRVSTRSGAAAAPQSQAQRSELTTRQPSSRTSASSTSSSKLSSSPGLTTRQTSSAGSGPAVAEARSGLPRLTSKLPTLTRMSGLKPPTTLKK